MTGRAGKGDRGPPLNIVIPLGDASAYPGKVWLDILLYLPYAPGKKKRLWMLTPAKMPEIEIDRKHFKPAAASAGHWLDFGITDSALTTTEYGFGHMRFFGITPEEARASWFIITEQAGLELNGNIENAEEALWGISRKHAGRTWLTPSRLTAGSEAKFELIYEASEKGLPPGSLISFAVPRAFPEPRCGEKGKDGCMEIVKADCPVDWLGAALDDFHKNNYYLEALYRLPLGLKPGSRFTVCYKPSFIFPFPITLSPQHTRYWFCMRPVLAARVAISGKNCFVPPLPRNSHITSIVPDSADRLHLFLPGRKKAGEKVSVVGILTDRLRNPVKKNTARGALLRLEGTSSKDLGTPAGKYTSECRFEYPLGNLPPGIYRVKAFSPDTGECIGCSNPAEIMGRGDKRPNIYWGEIHAHSRMGDGTGSFSGLFKHARDIASLDFAASAEHASYLTDNQWEWMQDVINSFCVPGRFVTLIGYEWSGKVKPEGHHNIYTSGARLELFRARFLDTSRFRTIQNRFKGIKTVVAGSHTKHAPDFTGTDYNELVRFFEIYSMCGIYEETGIKLLNRGLRLGFTGGGDSHDAKCAFSAEWQGGQGKLPHSISPNCKYKCGITAALAERLDRKSLIEALRGRRIYATTGARMLVDFHVSGIPMGSTGESARPEITASVHGCGIIRSITIMRSGKAAAVIPIGELDVQLNWTDTAAAAGNRYYYLKITQEDGETAWTSPVWISS